MICKNYLLGQAGSELAHCRYQEEEECVRCRSFVMCLPLLLSPALVVLVVLSLPHSHLRHLTDESEIPHSACHQKGGGVGMTPHSREGITPHSRCASWTFPPHSQ